MSLARAVLAGLRVAAAVVEAGREPPRRAGVIETRRRPDGVWEAVLDG